MRLAALSFFTALLLTTSVGAVSLEAQTLEVSGGIDAVIITAEGPLVRTRNGQHFRLTADAKALRRTPKPTTPPLPHGDSAISLPDGVVARSDGAFRKVWLTEPTTRYDHGILGDAIEAGGLAARMADGSRRRLSLGPEAVFEDRAPRLADLNGDGVDEILVVKTYLQRGGALAVIAATQSGLEIVAEAEPIGLTHRWLNPVGVADFDGDGRNEAAVVLTPHIGGTLQLYEWRGARLVEDHAAEGFSNHGIGMRELGMSALADINADGITDIVLPDAHRQSLIGVSFAGGKFRQLFQQRHPRPIITAIAATHSGAGKRFVYGLADDTLVVLDVRR